MKKTSLIFGSIAGSVVLIMMWLSFTIFPEFNVDATVGFTTMIIAFSAIFFGVRSYRDQELKGAISFKNAFLLGLNITLVTSTIYVISWLILSSTVASDFMENYSQQSIEEIQQSDRSEVEKTVAIQEVNDFKEMYKNPIIKIAFTYLEIFPVGLLISLFSAFLLRRE